MIVIKGCIYLEYRNRQTILKSGIIDTEFVKAVISQVYENEWEVEKKEEAKRSTQTSEVNFINFRN